MATFDEWLSVFDQVYRNLPDDPASPCPNCRHQMLRIVFTNPADGDVGYAALWCEACLEGTHICRAVVPPGVTARRTDAPEEERLCRIPNYRLAT
ncbi:MAG: hypothetical protein WA890_06300 [Micromonospora sp.]